MIVTYTPDGGTPEQVSTEDLSAIESAVIESATGLEWDDVERALKSQSPTAMRAVLWAFRKRAEPTLRFSQCDVPGWKRRLKARLESSEIVELVEALRDDDEAPEGSAAFEAMLGHLRTLAQDPADVERAMQQTAPKAPAPAVVAAEAPAADEPTDPEESAATS
ncbi:hypothetical protein ACIP9H_40525 [Streptomyces sp. NPDC088732]|uniref:hypothetical protein n=1 Tax=Streptomyces sp. NPDC088732 TaxID=3365879 RepID=UPI0038213510